MEEYNVYGLNCSYAWCDLDKSLKTGEGRYGFSSLKNGDLHQLKEKADRSGIDSLTDEEKACFHEFLLDLKAGDYVIYTDFPEIGKYTLAQVSGPYFWRYDDLDFNHRFPVNPESLKMFDSKFLWGVSDEIASQIPKYSVKWKKIDADEDFEKLMMFLENGTYELVCQTEPSTLIEKMTADFIERLKSVSNEQWMEICQRYERNGPLIKEAMKKVTDMIYKNLDHFRETKNLIYYDRARYQLRKIIHLLPKTIERHGGPYPFASTALEASGAAAHSFHVFDKEIKTKNKFDIAIACLAPFHGFIDLPDLDFNKQVSFAKKMKKIKKSLSKKKVYHLGFDEAYFTYDEAPPIGVSPIPRNWNKKQLFHETWKLPAIDKVRSSFGGIAEGMCQVCGADHLHHLITFPVQEGMPVTKITTLTLVSCLSCIGWEEHFLFFKHDKNGKPQPIDYNGDTYEPDHPARPLRATEVFLCTTPDEYKEQDWGESDDQNLHRVGGEPSWVQDEEPVDCPECNQKMKFLMQLDSGLPTEDGEQWLWGSGGVLYILWCNKCKISGQMWQCT